MKRPSPFVYWAQNDSTIFLRVDLRNVRQHNVAIIEEGIEVSATGLGGQGKETNYHFTIEFFLPVNPDESVYEVRETDIRINIRKKDQDWWPRLLYEQKKLPWLKIDFDRWQGDDESEEEEEGLNQDVSSQDCLRNKYPDVFKQLQKDELGYITESKRKIYLFCYNLFMFCGFLYVSAVLNLRYMKLGEDFIPEAYATVGKIMIMLHLFMFLEVLHPMFGYTKGSVLEAFLQVFGRNFVILALIESEERIQEKPVVFYLFFIYSIIELVRYPYYMLRVYDIDVGLITWLRYTAWIPLYPAGFVCEGVIMLRNIPYFEETEKFFPGPAQPIQSCISFSYLAQALPSVPLFPNAVHNDEPHVPAALQEAQS